MPLSVPNWVGSARLGHVVEVERLKVPLPHGQRAYVVSDLELTPTTPSSERGLSEFIDLLNDLDDASVVIVAGNLFAPDRTSDPTRFMAATFAAHVELRDAISRFTVEAYRRLIVIPGSRDAEIGRSDSARALLAEFNIAVARDVNLQVATASETRDLLVAAGRSPLDASVVDLTERTDAEHLEVPRALRRFAVSRLLYRRLARWMWFPLWALVLLDLAGTIVSLADRVTHHRWHVHATRPADVWTTIVIDLLVIAAVEGVLGLIAAWVVRRRFRDTIENTLVAPDEPLVATRVFDVDAITVARRVADRGGAGAIVGGAPRAALAFLDRGVCASPGPSRPTVIERRARLGLPPVFATSERFGVVEVEAATSVRVRLLGGQSRSEPATRLERWLATRPRQVEAPLATAAVGSWPDGEPWPPPEVRVRTMRRQRGVRKWASALLLLTGFADIVVAASPPLKGHLHAAFAILPIGVVQGAVAVSAISGFAMVMMARGVRRGQRRAWFVAVVLLLVSVITHLARGGRVGSSLLAVAVLAVLLFGRESFTASSDRSSVQSLAPRLALIALVGVISATVGIELTNLHHHHLPNWPTVMLGCIERLVGVTSIGLPDRVGDFVNPAMLTLGVGLLVTGLYVATRPVVDRRLSLQSSPAERRFAELRARDIVRRHGRGTLDYFALRDDKQFFFHRDSLVAYAVYGGVALVSPDPIGPASERRDVLAAFRHHAEQNGWTVGVIGAGEQWISTYAGAGFHHLYLGDEAVVNCPTFSLEGGKMKGLRQACGRLAKKGYTVSFHDPATIDASEVTGVLELIAKLRRGEGERGFSMMLGRLFDPRDQGLLLTIVKDPNGHPAAVCQFVPSPTIHGYSLDLMRRDPGDHPNGLIDYALCSTITYLAENGGQGLSLNFAAFRTLLDGEKVDGALTRIERWALKRLSGVLPIESLWSFNAKYDPGWLPRYIVYPAAESFVPVVTAILRAESITELPVLGRFLGSDPSNRPGTVVPDDVVKRARQADSLRR